MESPQVFEEEWEKAEHMEIKRCLVIVVKEQVAMHRKGREKAGFR